LTKQLGVKEILRSKKVKQMCNISKSFKDFVERLYDLDQEIKANNKLISTDPVQAAILASENGYLKKTKLQIKRIIIAIIADYEKEPYLWMVKNYQADNTKKVSTDEKQQQGSILCTPNGFIPETTAEDKKQKAKKTRSQQCRRRDTGRSQRRHF